MLLLAKTHTYRFVYHHTPRISLQQLFPLRGFAESRRHRSAQLPGDGRDGLHETKARLQVVVASARTRQHATTDDHDYDQCEHGPDRDPGAGRERQSDERVAGPVTVHLRSQCTAEEGESVLGELINKYNIIINTPIARDKRWVVVGEYDLSE